MVEYDDGGRDVPAGIERPVDRVVVVGAGIAGLTVASALARADVACVVLEARTRTGGRLHTVDLAGVPADLGGSWIHHPIGNPLRRLADQVHVDCRPGDPLPTLSAYDAAEGRRLSQAELAGSLDLQMSRFADTLERLRARLGPDASVAQGIDAFVADQDLPAGAARRARQALRAIVEADAAGQAEHRSLRWLWNEMEYEGDLFGDLPVGGYGSLVNALTTGVDIRLGVEVTQVEVGDAGVQVRSADGALETGSHVVVTVPLGVLKRDGVRFTPTLPPDHRGAIDRLGFGRYEKVVLRFEEAFWRDAGISHLEVFPESAELPALWIFDLDAFGDGPVLAAHLFHSSAVRMLGSTPDERVSWVLDQLARAAGRPCPAPMAVAVTSWGQDPFSAGAYSHVPLGASPDDLDLLGEPVHGRVLYAGEHTQSARTAYADGAMTSGIREAKRLLSAPAVRLGPPPPG